MKTIKYWLFQVIEMLLTGGAKCYFPPSNARLENNIFSFILRILADGTLTPHRACFLIGHFFQQANVLPDKLSEEAQEGCEMFLGILTTDCSVWSSFEFNVGQIGAAVNLFKYWTDEIPQIPLEYCAISSFERKILSLADYTCWKIMKTNPLGQIIVRFFDVMRRDRDYYLPDLKNFTSNLRCVPQMAKKFLGAPDENALPPSLMLMIGFLKFRIFYAGLAYNNIFGGEERFGGQHLLHALELVRGNDNVIFLSKIY